MSYTFIRPDYRTDGIRTSSDGLVLYRSHRSACEMLFMGQDLRDKLCLSVIRSDPESSYRSPDRSFVFGLTTCNASSILWNVCHATEVCGPDSACGGRSVCAEITSCSRKGYTATFERLGDSFVVTIYRKSYPLLDPDGIFRHQKAYPFIILNGTVSALQIVPASRLSSIRDNSRFLTESPQLSMHANESLGGIDYGMTATASSAVTFPAGDDCRDLLNRLSFHRDTDYRALDHRKRKFRIPDERSPSSSGLSTSRSDPKRFKKSGSPDAPVGNAIGMDAAVSTKNWLSNKYVAVCGPLISKTGEKTDPAYIFRNKCFKLDENIVFTIRGVSNEGAGVIDFWCHDTPSAFHRICRPAS